MHDSAKRAPCAWKAGGWVKIVLANSCAPVTAKLALVCLAAGADADGLCSMPVPTLAALCGLRDRQTQYDLAALVELGELVKVSAGKGGRGSATVYRINVRPDLPFPLQRKRRKGALGCTDLNK